MCDIDLEKAVASDQTFHSIYVLPLYAISHAVFPARNSLGGTSKPLCNTNDDLPTAIPT
jgi:hypothetical protein